MKLTFAKAEHLKRNATKSGAAELKKILGTLKPVLNDFVLEVQRSLDNFDRQFSQVALQRLLVASTAGVSSLVSYLAQNLYLPVEAADLAGVLDIAAFPALADPAEQARWMQAIGLALREDD